MHSFHVLHTANIRFPDVEHRFFSRRMYVPQPEDVTTNLMPTLFHLAETDNTLNLAFAHQLIFNFNRMDFLDFEGISRDFN